jgi:hypothetical protein
MGMESQINLLAESRRGRWKHSFQMLWKSSEARPPKALPKPSASWPAATRAVSRAGRRRATEYEMFNPYFLFEWIILAGSVTARAGQASSLRALCGPREPATRAVSRAGRARGALCEPSAAVPCELSAAAIPPSGGGEAGPQRALCEPPRPRVPAARARSGCGLAPGSDRGDSDDWLTD